MKKQIVLLALTLTLNIALCAAKSRPNIVIFFADDLGWADLGYRNSKFHTPNLDALQEQGLEFTRAYISTPTCSPSRTSILTGKEAVRLQMVRHISGPQIEDYNLWEKDPVQMPSRNFLPLEEVTYAERLKEYGYYNMFLGKWHLGREEKYFPVQQGFDEEYCTGDVFHKSYRPYYPNKNRTGTYKTDTITSEAIRLIQTYDRDQPFMMSVWYYNVHGGFQGRNDWVNYYQKKGLTGVDAEYAAMVSVMDESVGLIRTALVEKGLAENTIILFTSDQGGDFQNGHLSGGKRGGNTLGEGGARVPFIIYYPGHTKPKTQNNTPIQTIDVYPTLIEIASGEKCTEKQIQGKSLMPLLNGGAMPERNLYFFRSYEDQYAAIMNGDWKLIKYHSGTYRLFNLKADESEQHNLIDTETKRASKMKRALTKWEKEAVPEF